jgi:peptide-methionine (S)-S-oxide reductase
MDIAKRVTAELQEKVKLGKVPNYRGNSITTHITRATTFYPAHEDHQQYLDKNPGGYCNHGYRFTSWPK